MRMRIRYSTEKLIGSHRLSSAQQYPVESSRGEVEKARLQDAENRRWAKEPGANKLLAQPPFVEKANGSRLHTTDILKSLDNYLEVRLLLDLMWSHVLKDLNSDVTAFIQRA